jgi:hypothetical protein
MVPLDIADVLSDTYLQTPKEPVISAWAFLDLCQIAKALSEQCGREISGLRSSGRLTGNPHLTRRWPFGRVTEGLPTTHPEPRRSNQYLASMRAKSPDIAN